MAMNTATLATEIESELKAQGFITSGDHAKAEKLCTAIANAVVNHIKANAKAVVASGSSAGQHSIE